MSDRHGFKVGDRVRLKEGSQLEGIKDADRRRSGRTGTVGKIYRGDVQVAFANNNSWWVRFHDLEPDPDPRFAGALAERDEDDWHIKPASLKAEVALRMQRNADTARPVAELSTLQKCRKCKVTTDGCAKGHCPVCAARDVAAALQVKLNGAEASNEALRRRNQQLCKAADIRAREAKLNSAVAKLQSPHSPRKLRVDGGGW